jgi:xanthine dehydrogenase accessory factor
MEVAVVSLMPGADLSPFRSVIDGLQSQYAAELPVRILHQGRWIEYRLHVEATPTLLIAGAGHVGAALAKLAVDLDYRTVVIDDRADLMAAERLPPPIEPVAGDIAGTLRHWPIDANMYVVIVTRGHQHDEQALQAVINSPAKYVGMIGSRRKIGMIFDDLVELGVDRARLAQVHSPIGLKIGAVTVPEIAVSIAAELTQVRRAQTFQAITGPFDVACPR